MPLPWLIGGALVAAVAAFVAIADDDDTSGEEERRAQERDAARQRERDTCTARLANLQKNRLEEAHALLCRAAEVLGKHRGTIGDLTVTELRYAINSEVQASSEYAQSLLAAVSVGSQSEDDWTASEQQELMANLQLFEDLAGPVQVMPEEERDIVAVLEAAGRLERLKMLKAEIEREGRRAI